MSKKNDVHKIRAEIARRLQAGEPIESIRDDLKRRGISILDYAEADQAEEESRNPEFVKQGKRIEWVLWALSGAKRQGGTKGGIETWDPLIFFSLFVILGLAALIWIVIDM